MKLLTKRRLQLNIGIICFLFLLSFSVPVYAAEEDALKDQSTTLQKELEGINSEILEMSTDIANIEIQIEDTNNAITSTEEQIAIIENNESQQYEAMKLRIKYLYENGNASLLELLFSSKNMADFVNKADFIQDISSYDREQLTELQTTQNTIKEQQTSLNDQKASLESMEDDLNTKQDTLNKKAAETSTNINEVTAQIAQIKEAQLQAAQEKAEQEARATQAAATPASAGSGDSSQSSSGGSSGSRPNYSNSGGGLTPEKGVVYFNGHRETYYSQRVLPGTGLNIPGRHVAADGTIRDIDNYICVASSDLAKGTLVETSLGMGKVYDSGCASGTIDLYTDW